MEGLDPELDSFGGMGQMGLDFDYRAVSAQGGACTTTNGPACVLQLHFLSFDNGFRGYVVFRNKTKGALPGTKSCAPSPSAGAPAPEPFSISLQLIAPGGKAAQSHAYFTGTSAPVPQN